MVNLLYALHELSQYVATLTIASRKQGQSLIAASSLPNAIQQSVQEAGLGKAEVIS